VGFLLLIEKVSNPNGACGGASVQTCIQGVHNLGLIALSFAMDLRREDAALAEL